MVNSRLINLNNGRSALNLGIKILSIKKKSKILVPEIICDVAVKVLLKNELSIIYYRLNENFEPIWSDIKKKNSKDISSILMVHFFGFPQNIKKFKNFSKKNKIFLIEDNCHSLDIKYNNKILGKNGDIGIDSPRKIINNLFSGGRLHVNKNINFKVKNFEEYYPNRLSKYKKKIKNDFHKIYIGIKFLGKRPNYSSPFLHSDKDNNFTLRKMDNLSQKYLRKINLKKESLKRYKLLKQLEIFAKNNEIKSIFKYKKNLIPMCYVGVAKNKEHAQKIFDWGWKNKVEITSWPSFYSKTKLDKRLLERWRRYICIPLNQNFKMSKFVK